MMNYQQSFVLSYIEIITPVNREIKQVHVFARQQFACVFELEMGKHFLEQFSTAIFI